MAGKKTAEFMIVNRRSGKALQATGLDNGLVVEQAEPAKTDAQTWTSLETEGGVKFFNKACGKVLDVMANGTANGTWVQTWEDVDGESQLWKLVTVSPTYKKIVNVMADKALDIVDMSDEDGAPAQIWESVDGEGQQWKFVSTAPKAATKTVRKPAAKKAAAQEEAQALEPLRQGRRGQGGDCPKGRARQDHEEAGGIPQGFEKAGGGPQDLDQSRARPQKGAPQGHKGINHPRGAAQAALLFLPFPIYKNGENRYHSFKALQRKGGF